MRGAPNSKATLSALRKRATGALGKLTAAGEIGGTMLSVVRAVRQRVSFRVC
jgi:hypothetical protein